jgi:oligopeptide/dipeptide ABC transporter ATP-binding protein
VLDEPTSALDVSVQRADRQPAASSCARASASRTCSSSHDLAVVRRVADEIAVMYLGRIVEFGPREQVLRAPAHPYTRALMAAIPELVSAPVAPPAPLEGEPASPLTPPTGCAFHPRCPRRHEVEGERCVREAPLLVPRGISSVACHLR